MAVTHKLEVSFDPLSDLTPTWTDLSSRLLEVPNIRLGVDGDLDDPQPGSATFRLDNRDRALEPGYASSPYYANVRPLRRIRYLINDGSTDWPMFQGYILSWGPEWPGGMNQEAIISAGDGFTILELNKFPNLDPPDAETYDDVVMHDEPFAYYKLGEFGGTQMLAATGTEGVYKNTPTFQQEPQITGDAATSVEFKANEFGVAGVEDNQFVDVDALTVECWVEVTDNTDAGVLIAGPFDTGMGDLLFNLGYSTTSYSFNVVTTVTNYGVNVSSPVTALRHVVGVWDGVSLSLYLDGELRGGWSTSGTFPVPDADPKVRVGDYTGTGSGKARMSNVAVYEHALSAERVLAHYNAGSTVNGLPAELAGERVVSAVDNPLWSTAFVELGTHEVSPAMKHGQSRVEAVREAVKAEFPSSMFFFRGDGNPQYLGWEFGDTAPYNTVQATFGNAGGAEIPFADAQTTDEDELYNIVTAAREGGLAQTATDTASVAEFYDRNYDLTGLTHTDDMACMEVAQAILAFHSQPDPPTRIQSITLTSDVTSALAEILERMPGDLIRVKHRPKGGTAIDIITRIRGRTLSVAPLDGGNRVIACTWTLAKGFAAAPAYWHAGTVGFTEAGSTTKAK